VSIQANIQEAKGCLSRLIASAESGEHVVIARAGRPVVELTAVRQPDVPQFGWLNAPVGDGILDPLTEEELREWGWE
jgi:antitoxin (DNA-binding transcriptional repressor) of toxin-antitoxin stability system